MRSAFVRQNNALQNIFQAPGQRTAVSVSGSRVSGS